MFRAHIPRSAEEEQKDIFAPVSDLMVGVVFIFIILILALSLDLSDETTVPRSAYDAKVSETIELSRQLADARAALAASEQKVFALEAELPRLRAENAALRRDNAALTADKARLVDFVRFVRELSLIHI